MSISDAQFAASLADGRSQWVVLYEQDFVYQGAVAGGGAPANKALASAGATIVASSTLSASYAASTAIDGVKNGNNFGASGGWSSLTPRSFPQTLDITLGGGSQAINKVVLYSLQDNFATDPDPDDSTIAARYQISDFDVQGWDGAAWVTLASVKGNTYAMRTVWFTAYTTTKIRINITKVGDLNFARVVEVECWTAAGGSTPATGTMYFASAEYFTQPSDTPANVSYRARLLDAPRYTRSVNLQTLAGAAAASFGDAVLDNADGGISFIADCIIDGQEGRWYLGCVGWARADFRQMFTTHGDVCEIPQRGRVRVKFTDRSALFNTSVLGTEIGGDAGNARKVAPIVLGLHDQVEAFAVISSILKYRFADAAYYYPGVDSSWSGHSTEWNSIFTVYDNGADLGGVTISSSTVSWDATTNAFTKTAHGFTNGMVIRFTAGTLPTSAPQVHLSPSTGAPEQWFIVGATANTFQISHAAGGAVVDLTNTSSATMTIVGKYFFDHFDGAFTLTNTPVGKVTVSCSAGADLGMGFGGGVYDSALFKFILTVMAKQSASIIDTVRTSAYASGRLRLYLPERSNVADLLDRVALAGPNTWALTRANLFTLLSIRPQSLGSFANQATFVDDDITDDDLRVVQQSPLYRSIVFHYDYNNPPLDYVASGVTPASAAAMRLPYKTGRTTVLADADYATTPWRYHGTMVDGPEFETILDSRDISGGIPFVWANNYRDKFLPFVELRSFTAPFRFYTLELGDKVTCTMPLAAGDAADTAWQVGAIDLQILRLKIGFTLVRRRTPDTTTTVH
jgi:hypothetical protein